MIPRIEKGQARLTGLRRPSLALLLLQRFGRPGAATWISNAANGQRRNDVGSLILGRDRTQARAPNQRIGGRFFNPSPRLNCQYSMMLIKAA